MAHPCTDELELNRPPGGRDRRAAVIQLGHHGHRLQYVRVLAEACDLGSSLVLCTTAEAAASREFDVHLAELMRSGALEVAEIGSAREPSHRLLFRALRYARHARCRVLIPDADRLLPWLCWASLWCNRNGLIELRLLLMRTPEPSMRRPRRGALIALAKAPLYFALRNLWPGAKCYFLTDAFGVVVRRRGYGSMEAVRDPLPSVPLVERQAARIGLGLPDDAFVLGLLGYMSAAKHPRLTFEALHKLPPKVVALVAGGSDAETASAIATLQASAVTANRVRSVPGYLSDEQLGSCISACDAVVLTNELDAPSGMLASAVTAKIPVIAAGSPWVTHVVEHLAAGVITALSAEGVAEGVRRLMREGPPRIRMPGGVGATGLAEAFLSG